MKNNFCIIPFVHLNIGPRNEIQPCCRYTDQEVDDDGRIIHKQPTKISDTLLGAWNSSDWKELRKSFLNNEKPKPCFPCWEDEDAAERGLNSYRMYANKQHNELLPITETPKTPVWLQLKLGAKCNLACRTCSPDSSNKWFAEGAYHEVADKYNKPLEDVSRDERKKWSIAKQRESAWLYTDKFWNELKSITKGLERIEFTGGEPMLITEHYQYLEWCVEQGYAKNIWLEYSTNGTVELTDKMKDIWNNFKYVDVLISIDGYGKLAEYIRTGMIWEHTKKNILEYSRYFKNHLELTITVSVYNIYYIDELLVWGNKHNLGANFNMLYTPYESSIKYLPPIAKIKVIKKLNKYIREHVNTNSSMVSIEEIEALINFINSSTTDKSTEFCHTIKRQEKIRKLAHNEIMDYEKSFPEWWEILNE